MVHLYVTSDHIPPIAIKSTHAPIATNIMTPFISTWRASRSTAYQLTSHAPQDSTMARAGWGTCQRNARVNGRSQRYRSKNKSRRRRTEVKGRIRLRCRPEGGRRDSQEAVEVSGDWNGNRRAIGPLTHGAVAASARSSRETRERFLGKVLTAR